MPPTTATEEIVVLSHVEYEAIYAPPVRLKTPVELFDDQVRKWMSLGLLTAGEAGSLRDRLPENHNFLLVPDLSSIDVMVLIGQFMVNGEQGDCYLDPQYLNDVCNVPKGAHLLVDIRDGRDRLNTKPSVAQQQIETEERLGFTALQGLAFGIMFAQVLNHHSLDLVGSCYKSRHVPYLALNDGDRIPKLSANWHDYARPRSGAPSAGSMLGV